MIRRRLCIALLAVIALVLAGCGGGGSSSSGPTEIAVWHGYQDTEGEVFKGLIAQYNKDHPDVKVNELYSSNDLVLQKVLTAVRGGSAPDVAYMFGSWSPNIAQIPQVVDMAEEVKKPDWQWDDFYPAEREAATVGEKVVGVPALVDNLAIVYNKKLFADAGIAPPSPEWTWDDFRAAAAKLTDPSKGQYGWLIPADGSEDTVWHYIPMLWEAGGDILSPDNEKAVFNSEAGVKALTVLQQMAVTDKSLYLDTTNENGPKLMNSGKVGMLVTGGVLMLLVGLFAPASFLSHFIVFVLACFVGFSVIWNVAHSLHTPLMAITNAISSIVILGALLQIGSGSAWVVILAALAVLMTGVNIFGGFLVTRRMLAMFQKS